jgi:hypothetical protein
LNRLFAEPSPRGIYPAETSHPASLGSAPLQQGRGSKILVPYSRQCDRSGHMYDEAPIKYRHAWIESLEGKEPTKASDSL